MARFKVIVQVYKAFEFEAPSQLDAMRMADEEMKKSGTTDKYNVNHAKNLEKPKKAKKVVAEGQTAPAETTAPAAPATNA